MPSRNTSWLLVLAVVLFLAPRAFTAELKISGTKDFQYRSFSITGSLNQFLVDHPTFLSDRGFRQSLRLNVTGELVEGVAVDVQLDDTNDVEKDRKLLITAGGKDFNVTAGRLTLDFPGTRYLIFNKKALAAIVNYRVGDHTLTVMAGRPEGDPSRDFFRGLGARAEYLLTQRPVVQGSEIVVLDGRQLARGGDYSMDYDEGTLILNRRMLPVEATSSITVEYEAQATGSAFRSTVVGFREQMKLPRWDEGDQPVKTRASVVFKPLPPDQRAKGTRGDLLRALRERVGTVREKAEVAVALVERGIVPPSPIVAKAVTPVAAPVTALASPIVAAHAITPATPAWAALPALTPATPAATPAKPAEPAIMANFGLPGDPLPETKAKPTQPVTPTAPQVTASAATAQPAADDADIEPAVPLPEPAASDDPPPPASAVTPSPILTADRARLTDSALGAIATGAQPLASGDFSSAGNSSFSQVSNSAVPLPQMFGTSDPSYSVRRPVSAQVNALGDRAGVSVILSTESDTEVTAASQVVSTANTSPTTATPRQLGIVGADVAYRFGGGWRVSGEAAHSILDTNRRIEDDLLHGTAWDVALSHSGPRWDFRLARQHLGAGFEAVGKREFTRLGEVADLASDLNITSASSRFDITRSIFLDSAGEISETNLTQRTDRPTRDFVGVGNGLSWVFQPQGRLLLRHRDDVSDVTQPGVAPAHVEHRVRAASVTKPIGKWVAQARAEQVEDRGIAAELVGDTATYALSLGDSSRRLYKWSFNATDVRFSNVNAVEQRDALSFGGLLDLSFSKYLNGSVSALDRTEKNLVTNEELATRTGEMRVRYQPFTSLNLNTKAAAEERSRIVRQTADPLLALIPQAPGQRTLVAEKPVVATNASHTADWQPSKRWDHRLSYRTRDEKEVASGTLISKTEAAGYRVRFAPGQVFRTTTEVETGRSLSKVANFDRDTWLLAEELLWSFASGLNLTLSYNDNDTKDRTGRGLGRDRTAVSAASAERTLGRYFTGLAKLSRTNRIQGGSSNENAIGMGIRYALPHDPLRVQLDGEIAGVEGVNPAGTAFDSKRHKAGFRVDGQPAKDINVECAVTWVKAGANALGDNGYSGFTVESKAFVDF